MARPLDYRGVSRGQPSNRGVGTSGYAPPRSEAELWTGERKRLVHLGINKLKLPGWLNCHAEVTTEDGLLLRPSSVIGFTSFKGPKLLF